MVDRASDAWGGLWRRWGGCAMVAVLLLSIGCTRTVERERGWVIEPADAGLSEGEREIVIGPDAEQEWGGEDGTIYFGDAVEAGEGQPLRVGVPHGAPVEYLEWEEGAGGGIDGR